MEIKVHYSGKKSSPSGLSELRHDLLTGDWVVVATARARRPEQFIAHDRPQPVYDPLQDPFADPEASGQEKDVLIYRDSVGEWTTRVFPNKYPAFAPNAIPHDLSEGPYFAMSGFGYHEIVVTRHPQRHFALLRTEELAEVIDAYQERYRELMTQRSIRSINIIHNHGERAGASVIHPHSQIFATTVLPPIVRQEIAEAERYWKQNHVSLFDIIAEYEIETKARVIYHNDDFLVYCPFASERAFEVRILPRKAQPYFERLVPSQKQSLADALSMALRVLHLALDNPDYNFYFHTAPCDGASHDHYAWHIDILPHTSVPGGFEFSTSIEISTIRPEDAAAYLRAKVGEAQQMDA